MENKNEIDGKLLDWSEVKDSEDWSGILIGNGASIAVWDKFRYSSIFDMARSHDIEKPLIIEDTQLFKALATTNFEQVLSSLSTTNKVNKILGINSQIVEDRYNSIKTALIQAVRSVHVPWSCIPDQVLLDIQNELLEYKYIYSLNYDLLIYWAMMHKKRKGFKDYFFNGEKFDISNIEIWEKATSVLYFYGGLHLLRLPTGQTLKRRQTPGQNLLDTFGSEYQDGASPLFVSEGTSEDKLSSIFRSDYLSFALSMFSNHKGSLIIFGLSLSDHDKHIISEIKKWNEIKLAISMMPNDATEIRIKKAEIIAKLPKADIQFFNATTHPLGSPSLKILEK